MIKTVINLIALSTCLQLLNCKNHKNVMINETKIDPSYLKEFSEMKNINVKGTLITSPVRDMSNKEFKLNEVCQGHISVIKLWAIWCAPCIESMADYELIQEEYKAKNDIRFYTMSIDYTYEDYLTMINKKNWKGHHYWAGADPRSQIYHLSFEVMDSMVLSTLPNYFILDKEGRLIENIVVGDNTKSKLKEVLKKGY